MGRTSIPRRRAASPRPLDAENSFWQLDAEEALRALRLDYTMLFTNPEGAVVSPYEACFKGSDDFDSSGLTFISPTALDAERVYRQLGIKPSGYSNESADHMASRRSFSAWSTSSLLGQLMTAATRSASGSQPSWRTSTAAIS